MAGRVNTRFVITLSAVLVMVFGGLLAAALWIKLHNAPELLKKGDARMEAGRTLLAAGKFAEAQTEFESAEKLYSKAVYKEQQNPAYVQKWVDSLRAWVPENQSRLADAFQQRLVPSLRMVAIAKKNDIAAHREYLGLLYRLYRIAPGRKPAEHVISEVDRTMTLLRGDPSENGEAQTLRRYRGLIVTSMMTSRGMELTPEQMDQALADLEAASKADPNDSEAVVNMVTWYDARSRMATTNNKPEEARAFDAKAKEAISTFVTAHPTDILGSIYSLKMSLYEGIRANQEKYKKAEDERRASRELAEKFTPAYERVWGLVEARGGDMTIEELGAFQDVESFFTTTGKFPRTQQVLRAMIAKHPDRADAYQALAQLLTEPEQMPEALKLLQTVVDMPPLPVGFEAIHLYSLKAEALYLKALYAYQQWESSGAPQSDAAKVFLAESRKARDDMALYVGTDSERLLFLDGLQRFAESDWLGAKKLLTEYMRRIGGQDIKAEYTLAVCEIRLRNNGAALDLLTKIATARPDVPGPIIQRAALLSDMGRPEDALASLESLLQSDPDNAAAKKLVENIRLATGAAQGTDPVQAAYLKASRLAMGSAQEPADPASAMQVIEDAIKQTPDPRLYQLLSSLKLERGDPKGAVETLEAGVKAYPDDQELARVLEGIKSDDPVAWSIKKIDEMKDVPEVDRLLRKYAVFATAAANPGSDQAEKAVKWRADADATLEKVAEIAPDDQRVVDTVFTRAISTRDWPRAEKMVERAAAKDFDRVGGAMYKGRLLFAKGQVSEAAAVLRDAADKGIADVASLRLLAICYQQLGRAEDAENYFQAAIKLRPTDAPTQIMYLTMLRNQGRSLEALAKAREAESACRASPEFMNLLVSLMAEVGSPAEALAQREKTYERDPRNVGNTLALINLYIDAKRWDDARKALDALRSVGDGSDFALAEARLYADQGDFTKALGAMDDFIKRQDPKKLKYDVFITFGRFLIDRKRYPEGIEMMRRGEPFQSPKVMEVDRTVAETLVEIGQPDVAAEVLRFIVKSEADSPRQEVRIRLAELLAALNNFKEADEVLQQVKPPSDIAAQAQVMLIRADVAHGLKDDKRAEELYNQAVAQFATDPMVYFRRAQFYMASGTAKLDRALTDLDSAIRVRPAFWQARRLRSVVYAAMGGDENVKKAIADVKEALRLNPALDDLRIQLLNELISRDQPGDAAEVADAAAQARPNDFAMFMSFGQTFAQANLWDRAAYFYGLGWNRSGKQRPDIAQAYLNATLNTPNPNLGEVEEVFRDLQKAAPVDPKTGAKADVVLSNSGLLMARAKLLMRRNRSADAVKDVMASMVAMTPAQLTAEGITTWAQELRRLFPKPADQIEILSRKDVPAKFADWARYFRAGLLMENPATRTQAASQADELLASAKDPDVRRLTYRMRGTLEFVQRNYPAAEAAWRAGVKEFKDDWELNNNLAYLLARYLDRPQEAIEFGENAGKTASGISEAVDTYGYVLMKAGKFQEAEVEFKKALAIAKSPATRASVLLHLARSLLEQNKKDQVRVLLTSAGDLMKRDPAIESANKDEYAELDRRLNSP